MNKPQESSGLLQRGMAALGARQDLIRKAGSFAAVGLVNSAVDYGIFLLAYERAGLPLIPANVVAWVVAVSGSYVMNSYFTFAAESGRQLRSRAYGAFVLSGVAGFVANTSVLFLASYAMPVRFAKIVAIGASFLVNFSLSHFVVFRPKRDER